MKIPRIVKRRGAHIEIISKVLPKELRGEMGIINYLYGKIINKFALTNGKFTMRDVNKYIYDLLVGHMIDKHNIKEDDIEWNKDDK